jgi:hypothetical protein
MVCGVVHAIDLDDARAGEPPAASTSISALALASRAPWTASPGRSSVLDGMQAQ